MTLNDQTVLTMINELLEGQGVAPHRRELYVLTHRGTNAALRALGPVVDRYSPSRNKPVKVPAPMNTPICK